MNLFKKKPKERYEYGVVPFKSETHYNLIKYYSAQSYAYRESKVHNLDWINGLTLSILTSTKPSKKSFERLFKKAFKSKNRKIWYKESYSGIKLVRADDLNKILSAWQFRGIDTLSYAYKEISIVTNKEEEKTYTSSEGGYVCGGCRHAIPFWYNTNRSVGCDVGGCPNCGALIRVGG